MKNKFVFILIVSGITLAFVAGCTNSPTPEATALVETATMGPLPTVTPEAFDPQMLLEQTVDNFLTASSLQMKTHDITSYEAITADSSVRAVYGEFESIYDIIRTPEMKIRIQSQFRF